MRRAWPVLEGLEERRLLSQGSLLRPDALASTSAGGAFSNKDREFTYTTPTGGQAVIQIVGLGNLTGTSVDSSGALHLVYSGTNAYTKIVGQVHGGDGRAPLASILNGQLITASAQNSLSGVGGNVLQSVLLSHFDLVPGGTITLTPGVNSLVLDSVGPGTQIHLRQLPPAPAPTSTSLTGNVQFVSTQSATGSTSLNQQAVLGTTTSGTTAGRFTLQAGQSATLTTPYGTSTTYVSDADGAQTLTAITGQFTSAGNIVESLASGQPHGPPPAPPGVILKVNRITGAATTAINPLTDSRIFGYDPTAGQLIRFKLDLANGTGEPDNSFTPISVPGPRTSVGVNLGRNGNQLDVLVSSGKMVYAYNATTGAPDGSFTTSVPINSIASTDTVTVLGSFQTNQLSMINLPASLQTGTEQPALGNPQSFTPPAGFTLLGGLTGLPGTNTVYAAVAAIFNSFQSPKTQLGVETISTAQGNGSGHGPALVNQFSSVSQTAITQKGQYTTVQTNPPIPNQPGTALGSVDQSFALVASFSNGVNVVNLSNGVILIQNHNLLTGLSANFRPDLAGSALVDIQGSVQSIRGRRADGLVLNDTGNLNLVKFTSASNATIIGQPIGHVQIKNRSNVSILSSARNVNRRNGVNVVSNLQPIGPLSLPDD
jgi:hypothetical protein